MAWWAAAAGGALGKVLGKAAEWVPSKAEARRNSLKAYKKERDEILKQKQSDRNTARLHYILERISVLESAAVQS